MSEYTAPTLAEQVSALERRAGDLESLAEEMLATIKLNLERGNLKAEGAHAAEAMKAIIARWDWRFLRAGFESVADPEHKPFLDDRIPDVVVLSERPPIPPRMAVGTAVVVSRYGAEIPGRIDREQPVFSNREWCYQIRLPGCVCEFPAEMVRLATPSAVEQTDPSNESFASRWQPYVDSLNLPEPVICDGNA